MKVLILTEAGKSYGFGHIIRCMALGQGLRNYLARVKNRANERMEIKIIIKGENVIREIFDEQIFKIEINDWVKNYRRLGSEIIKQDLIIIDSYEAGKKTYDFIYNVLTQNYNGVLTHKLICIDDNNRMPYPPCVLVNPSIYGEKLKYFERPLFSKPDFQYAHKHIYLLGKDYIILRSSFSKISRKYTRKNIKNLLITFGGAEWKGLLKIILSLLKRYPDFKYHIVISSFNSGFESEINSLAPYCNTNIYYNISEKDMLALMSKCDLCVSGGGQTLYELMRCRVPTIGICFADNQRFNLESLKELGLIEYIGWHNDSKLLNKLINAINKLKLNKTRLLYSKLMSNVIDGNGVRRIVNIIMNECTNKT